MHSALEVKDMIVLIDQHRGKWRQGHSVILACLLAHRNAESGKCCPSQGVIAAYCVMDPRTLRRYLAELEAWGIITKTRPGRTATNQYTISLKLLSLPRQLDLELSRADKRDSASGHSCVRSRAGIAVPAEVEFEVEVEEEIHDRTKLAAAEPGKGEPEVEETTESKPFCEKHPDSGISMWGTCYACYSERCAEASAKEQTRREAQADLGTKKPSAVVCVKHPDSGLTMWGTCYACYSERCTAKTL